MDPVEEVCIRCGKNLRHRISCKCGMICCCNYCYEQHQLSCSRRGIGHLFRFGEFSFFRVLRIILLSFLVLTFVSVAFFTLPSRENQPRQESQAQSVPPKYERRTLKQIGEWAIAKKRGLLAQNPKSHPVVLKDFEFEAKLVHIDPPKPNLEVRWSCTFTSEDAEAEVILHAGFSQEDAESLKAHVESQVRVKATHMLSYRKDTGTYNLTFGDGTIEPINPKPAD